MGGEGVIDAEDLAADAHGNKVDVGTEDANEETRDAAPADGGVSLAASVTATASCEAVNVDTPATATGLTESERREREDEGTPSNIMATSSSS